MENWEVVVREMVDIQAQVLEQRNNSLLSSHPVTMTTQIDTWNGPAPSIPNQQLCWVYFPLHFYPSTLYFFGYLCYC